MKTLILLITAVLGLEMARSHVTGVSLIDVIPRRKSKAPIGPWMTPGWTDAEYRAWLDKKIREYDD